MFEVPKDVVEFLRQVFGSMLENAQRLLADARGLFERGSYASSAFLALSAIEELAGLGEVRRPFVLIRKEEDLKGALDELSLFFSRRRERQETAIRPAPFIRQGPKEWRHVVEGVSRLSRLQGEESLLEKRLQALWVDADPGQQRLSRPKDVSREEAYFFIGKGYELLAEAADGALNPFPFARRDPALSFAVWQEAMVEKETFTHRHGYA